MPSKKYCFKTYAKERAWKQIIQWLIIGAASVVFLGTFAVADAYAAASTKDIEGVTITVGTPDESELDFDVTDADYGQYAARLYYSGTRDAQGNPYDFELRGWVWNDNFGWISLYCGADGENLGVSCGDIPYGIKIDLSNEGRMYGWAWGDNIGWISFDCQGTKNENLSCGSTEYGSYLTIDLDTGLGDVDANDLSREPMAWSDTVGKFSLNGITSAILDIMIEPGTEEAPYGIWTKVENPNGDADAVPQKNQMPAADGTQGYDLFVNVADILGNPIDPSFVTINTNWDNKIQKDQTINDTSEANLKAYKKSAWDYTGTTSGGVTNTFHQKISSLAPTDKGNCYDPENDGCDFAYKEFADETIQEQKLEYLGGDVTVTVGVESVTEALNFVTSPIRELEFVAPIEITELSFVLPGYPDPINVIQSTRNSVDTFNINVAKHGNPGADSIKLELTTLETDVDYNFIDSIDENPLDGLNIKETTYGALNALSALYAIPFTPNPESSEDLLNLVEGAELRSIIEFPGTGVKYHNNGLPRTDDSEIINQTVEILSGSVFSPGAIKASQEADVTLYGDVAVYEARTRVLEDVSRLVRGTTVPSKGTMTIDAATTESDLTGNILKEGRVYFFEDTDVHLESLDALLGFAPAGQPVSIILRDGDLYVDGNINESGDPTPIGLIVLESATDHDEDTKGGHIYVRDDVTDMVEVSIFADGPMFRYSTGMCFNNGLREPNYVDASYDCGYEEPTSALSNQFYLRGNVATMNCIGCSVSTAPTRGDGTLIPGGQTAKNFAIARLYDLNYFSYFRLHPVLGTPSGSLAVNVPASAPANRPVYIEYSPAPSTMFGLRSF